MVLAVLRWLPGLCSLHVDVPVLLVEPRCCLQPAEHPVPVPALGEESWALCLRKVWGEGPWGWYSSEAPLTDEFALSFLESPGLSVFFIFITLFNLLEQPGFAGLGMSHFVPLSLLSMFRCPINCWIVQLSLAVFTPFPGLFWIA